MNPYEYHNDQLGVQARFIVKGKNAHPESLKLIGERGLQHRIEKGYINRLRPNGPNTPMLVRWLGLPPEWQRTLIENFGEPVKQLKQSWFEKHYQRDTAAYNYYLSYRLDDSKPLPDTVIEEYTLNASVLNTAEKVYNNRKSLRKAMRGKVKDIWGIVSNECNRFRDIQPHTLPMNAVSLRRKLREYQKSGYRSLVHGMWCNKSALKVDDHVVELLNNMFSDVIEKPTATEISRRYDGFLDGYVQVINNHTGEEYQPSDYPKLSKSTIKNYLAKWTNKAATHSLRSGNRQQLMSQYKPYHTLEQPRYAGSIISIDDRQPPFEYSKGQRVWFYNGIDLGSEAITVWVYGKSKEGIILDFYQQLVRNYTLWGLQVPAELEGEMSLNSMFKDTFLKEGAMFEHVRIEANNARGKRIEAYYRQLRYGLEKSREGWIARPFAISEANQAGPRQTPIIPYEQIIEGCLRDIQTWNNMEHSKIKGKSRWQVFIENQHPNINPTNWRGFLKYLGNKTRTTCKLGFVRFNNKQFVLGENGKIAYSAKLIKLMEQIEGKEVEIFWLDYNNGHVLKALVYQYDRYICEAIAKPTYSRAKIEQTPQDDENRTAMSKYEASVRGFINSQKQKIDKVTVIDNRPKTIDNSFVIPELKPVKQEMPEYEEAEILDPIDELDDLEQFDDDLNSFERQYKPSLKDRF